MYKKRLFERIMDLDNANDNACSKEEQIRSIIHYLSDLLSVRKGSYICSKDFGMENIYNSCDESFSTFILNAKEEMEYEITQYEPRLKEVIVVYEGSDNHNSHRFRIEGKLVEHNDQKITLQSALNFDGKISIEY